MSVASSCTYPDGGLSFKPLEPKHLIEMDAQLDPARSIITLEEEGRGTKYFARVRDRTSDACYLFITERFFYVASKTVVQQVPRVFFDVEDYTTRLAKGEPCGTIRFTHLKVKDPLGGHISLGMGVVEGPRQVDKPYVYRDCLTYLYDCFFGKPEKVSAVSL